MILYVQYLHVYWRHFATTFFTKNEYHNVWIYRQKSSYILYMHAYELTVDASTHYLLLTDLQYYFWPTEEAKAKGFHNLLDNQK